MVADSVRTHASDDCYRSAGSRTLPVAVCLIMGGMMHELEHQIFFDYVPFIILLLALFVITGGIHFSGDLKAKPWVNTGFLGLGWILASIMGTTGAAMLLIRPLIETNKQRDFKVHTILFFIALVANCGGLLTPLGDPPLFMLFLRGAHFSWFLHLAPEWATTGIILLGVYFLMDTYYYKKEHWTSLSADSREATPMVMKGTINFVYLLGVVLAVAFVNEGTIKQMGEADAPLWLKYLRVQLGTDRRGGSSLLGNLHHHDAGSGIPQSACCRPRLHSSMAVLLLHGCAVGIPGQHPDGSCLPRCGIRSSGVAGCR